MHSTFIVMRICLAVKYVVSIVKHVIRKKPRIQMDIPAADQEEKSK